MNKQKGVYQTTKWNPTKLSEMVQHKSTKGRCLRRDLYTEETRTWNSSSLIRHPTLYQNPYFRKSVTTSKRNYTITRCLGPFYIFSDLYFSIEVASFVEINKTGTGVLFK